MTEHIPDNEMGSTSIHVGDTEKVAALVKEMRAMVGRLRRETMELREEVAQLRTEASTAELPSTPRLHGAVPDDQLGEGYW
ncbi:MULTISPECIES: hypothetical protein [Streptomyces]|uniref:Uncharacterized protein n=2 Tax=Streptomyces TaxID=1883 RepID=A0A927QK35_9ACTN|nr:MULTISPECIES: hypothetical protein [Streptomyces]MBD9730213.1 hypothetical protein [Streptomyces caniscabiei]MDX3868067.1 hypothetical protein [Streptomyces europaeiscabiei]